MKQKLITFIAISVLLTVFLSAGAGIEFEQTGINFGTIDAGKVVEIKFNFKNTGDQMLIIKKITSGCGCLVVLGEKKEFNPGEKGSIPIKFYSRGFQGKIAKLITVTTNVKDKVYHRLKIYGFVELKDYAAIEIIGSERINFGSVKTGISYSRSLQLKNTGTNELKILDTLIPPEICLEYDQKKVRPGQTITVKLKFKPIERGNFTGFIKIRSNAYRQRLLIVKIQAQVK